MAKKKRRNKQTSSSQDGQGTNPWLGKRTGIVVVIVGSILLAAATAWQLAPSLGLGRSLLWGAGFAVAMWIAFLLVLAFNVWIRSR